MRHTKLQWPRLTNEQLSLFRVLLASCPCFNPHSIAGTNIAIMYKISSNSISLVTSTQRSPIFNPKRFHVGTKVEKVAVEQIFLRGLRFSPSESFNQCFLRLSLFFSPTIYDFIKCQLRYITILHKNIYLSVAY